MIYCAKVYANSLLAVLNSRVALESNSRDASGSTQLSTGFHVSPVADDDQNNGDLSQVCITIIIIIVVLCA